MDILLLRQTDIAAIISMTEIIQADKDALAIYSAGGADIPLRVNLNIAKENGQSLYMPGYAAQANALGIKLVSVYPDNAAKGKTNVPATMILLNEETGEVCALLDGTYLTQLRTGAVSGAASDLLAVQDSRVFALFGSGGQAEAQLEAVLSVRPIEQVKVFDISLSRAQQFVAQMQRKFAERFGVKIEVGTSPEQTVQDADIITAVTTATTPVFPAAAVKAGAHINGVGSYTPNMQELPPELLAMAGKIYVDTRDGVLNESGDFIIPMQQGSFTAAQITGELGEAINGKTPLRENDKEITLFKSTGSAVLDIVAAKRIYEQAVAQNKGQKIVL